MHSGGAIAADPTEEPCLCTAPQLCKGDSRLANVRVRFDVEGVPAHLQVRPAWP